MKSSTAYSIKLYLLTLLGFFAIDMIWLGIIAPSFYRKHIGFLLSSQPNWTPAIIFYLIFVGGLLVFVIRPGIRYRSLKKIVILGVVYGIVTYGTYDLTNLATIENWPILVTVVDMVWGVFLSISVAAIGYFAGTRILTPSMYD
jgi:uncharacterized membrane protein